MARKRRSIHPSDPTDIARRRAAEREKQRLIARDPAQWGIDAQSLALPANEGVSMVSGGVGGNLRVSRQDVFDLFLGRGKLSVGGHGAVRRLQNDVASLHRSIAGGSDYSPRVDRTRTSDGFTDQRLRAGRRIEAVLALAGPASARLLGALCELDVGLGRPGNWRDQVSRVTGETLADAQGAILRAACENLAGAYDMVDRGRGNSG